MIKNGWISINDRLPKKNIFVLGTDGCKYEIVKYTEENSWAGATSEYGYLMSLKYVNYWSPLLKLPQKNEHN